MEQREILALLREYKRNNSNKYGILELGVFGSVARNEARDDSDVDICIRTKTPDAFMLVHIKEEIETLLRKHVDIIRVRDTMNPCLKSRITKEALYV